MPLTNVLGWVVTGWVAFHDRIGGAGGRGGGGQATFLLSDIQETAVIVRLFSMGIPALMALACVLVGRDAAAS